MKSLPNTVEIANGLFVDDKSSFNENTLSILEKSYSAGCDVLDFSSPSSVEYINNWCNESTHGMIPGIVSDLNGYSLVAANALYFKDNWLSQIDDNRVMEDGKFTTINGDIQTCNMMLMSEDRYLENDKAIGFIKPYANQRYGFVAILPKEQGLFNFSDLDVDSLMNSVEYDATVIASMPEFSFDSTLSLTAVLCNLGLSGLFENAYCDSLLDNEIAIVDEILQKTKVDVNREGTEASAVTAIMVKNTAFVESKEYVVNLDRPFAFMIYDFEENIPLFMGKVMNME